MSEHITLTPQPVVTLEEEFKKKEKERKKIREKAQSGSYMQRIASSEEAQNTVKMWRGQNGGDLDDDTLYQNLAELDYKEIAVKKHKKDAIKNKGSLVAGIAVRDLPSWASDLPGVKQLQKRDDKYMERIQGYMNKIAVAFKLDGFFAPQKRSLGMMDGMMKKLYEKTDEDNPKSKVLTDLLIANNDHTQKNPPTGDEDTSPQLDEQIKDQLSRTEEIVDAKKDDTGEDAAKEVEERKDVFEEAKRKIVEGVMEKAEEVKEEAQVTPEPVAKPVVTKEVIEEAEKKRISSESSQGTEEQSGESSETEKIEVPAPPPPPPPKTPEQILDEDERAELARLDAEEYNEFILKTGKRMGDVSEVVGAAGGAASGINSLVTFVKKEQVMSPEEMMKATPGLSLDQATEDYDEIRKGFTDEGRMINNSIAAAKNMSTGIAGIISDSMRYDVEKQDLDDLEKKMRHADMAKNIGSVLTGATAMGLQHSGENPLDNNMAASLTLATQGIIDMAAEGVKLKASKDRVKRMRKQAAKTQIPEISDALGLGVKDAGKDGKFDGTERVGNAIQTRKIKSREVYGKVLKESGGDVEKAKLAQEQAEDEMRKMQLTVMRRENMQNIAMDARSDDKKRAKLKFATTFVGMVGKVATPILRAVGLSTLATAISVGTGVLTGATDFITGLLLDKAQGALMEKRINEEINIIKVEGGPRAALISDISNYNDLKKKFKVAFAIATKDNPEMQKVSDPDFKACMSIALADTGGGKKGLINAFARQNAMDVENGEYGTQEDEDFLKAAGVVRREDGSLPSRKVLAQRLGGEQGGKGVYTTHDDNKKEARKDARAKRIEELKQSISARQLAASRGEPIPEPEPIQAPDPEEQDKKAASMGLDLSLEGEVTKPKKKKLDLSLEGEVTKPKKKKIDTSLDD